jgi:hypothetical protein
MGGNRRLTTNVSLTLWSYGLNHRFSTQPTVPKSTQVFAPVTGPCSSGYSAPHTLVYLEIRGRREESFGEGFKEL